jgi:topoisomerase-4 subunit A
MEKLAEQFNEKKLPLVADMRDESAEDVRIVFEPRSKNVDAATMMETLFRASELETRVPLNMNVLVDGVVPRVVDLADALRQWLDHRRVVLNRRSKHRLTQIEHRLEVLSGMIVAYLNLDEVIRIIREEDEPKESLKAAFKLTDVQANYILDTRLRSLRKLEEMELRREHEELKKEKADIESLLASDAKQWKQIAWEIGDLKKRFGPKTKIGARRTTLADAPTISTTDLDDMLVEREPVTVVLSEKGWIRALKGHVADLASLTFKGDDRLKASIQTETTAKILVLATNGKAFTLDASKLPGGRGFGEPVRLMAEIDEGADVALIFAYKAGAKRLVVSTQGRGFIVAEDEMIAGTRKGRAVLNVDSDAELKLAVPIEGDHVAIVGENRKLLVYPLNQTPEMPRGKGVRLQRYVDGGVSDAKTFAVKEGLTWLDPAGRTFTVHHADLRDWIGNRADAGRLPPKGFPKSNRFA